MNLLRQFLTLGIFVGPYPVTLTDGQVADAVPVQNNFEWVRSQVNANIPNGLATVFKTTAQSVSNSTTAALDSALFFNASTNTYACRLHVAFICFTSIGFKFQMSGTAPIQTSTRYFYNGYWDSGSGPAAQSGLISASTTAWPAGVSFVPISSNPNNGWVEINCIVQTSNPGTVGFAWAQSVSGGTPTQVLAGSYLEWAVVA